MGNSAYFVELNFYPKNCISIIVIDALKKVEKTNNKRIMVLAIGSYRKRRFFSLKLDCSNLIYEPTIIKMVPYVSDFAADGKTNNFLKKIIYFH